MTEPLFDLDGRVVVITGGTGFLGRQHAEIVAQYGATPVLLDLSSDEAKAVATGLTERYEVEALGIAVDITIEFEIQKCRDILLQRFGHIDVLINNAANNPNSGAYRRDPGGFPSGRLWFGSLEPGYCRGFDGRLFMRKIFRSRFGQETRLAEVLSISPQILALSRLIKDYIVRKGCRMRSSR